eukprot:TRINITY_DN7673_c0_g1_i1.p1 TRINITY_DN7673_c0_g1~~TRINITY_DN7673_c0_g1_i1.p1  ORF type:complete len:632 (-),score=109.41 TRINITY_DN7673_c0_g1_i1:122-2017(-)
MSRAISASAVGLPSLVLSEQRSSIPVCASSSSSFFASKVFLVEQKKTNHLAILSLRKHRTATTVSVSPKFQAMEVRSGSQGLVPSESDITSLYATAMNALSTLISSTGPVKLTRPDYERQFIFMHDYLKILDMEESLSKLKVIHVAGTKGKGSTCAFTECILRSCGFRTGLFTSPHLIDTCERFRLDGLEISQEKFLSYFWWCWDKLKANCTHDVPMPTFFRFVTLLAFKIFIEEKVDVAILEVGLGGTFDATNVVRSPIVCGISSLGYDHMEILGNTLTEIATEKAGILKHGSIAITVPQPEEAMAVLERKAAELLVPLEVALPLDSSKLGHLKLSLNGEHQYINAGLAVALCHAWLHRTGYSDDHNEFQNMDGGSLPKPFIKGLTTTDFPGRSQIIHHPTSSEIIFYLDGAHTPESMEVCSNWFSNSIKESMLLAHPDDVLNSQNRHNSKILNLQQQFQQERRNSSNTTQILIFNCMNKRDPLLLLPRLLDSCARHGVHFSGAFFVPNQLAYNQIGSVLTPPPSDHPDVDLTWQLTLQRTWEKLINRNRDNGSFPQVPPPYDILSDALLNGSNQGRQKNSFSAVMPSLSATLRWLEECVHEVQPIRFQVLVTGSLHLIGDTLRLLKSRG